MPGPKSMVSLNAGLRASGNGSTATMVPIRISTARNWSKPICAAGGAAGSWARCMDRSPSSLRAKRSNPSRRLLKSGLLRRFAPRNDGSRDGSIRPNFFRDADVEPTERVDRQLIARVDHDRGGLGLDDRGPVQRVARLEIVQRIDIDLAPCAEEGLAPRPRPGGRRPLHRLRDVPACGHRADRGHACVDEHDLLIARGIGVKLFMPEMEALLDLGDQLGRVEI